MEDLVLAEYTATCHTQGCENEGIELLVHAPAENPHIVCGPCGAILSEAN